MSEPTEAFVAVESINDGEVGWLAGPFPVVAGTSESAEEWRERFIADAEYDPDFVYIVWPTPPDDVIKAFTS